jgi:hypothetical protein
MHARRTLLAATALVPVLALTGAVRRHITPTVVLEKQADMIRATVPGATRFFLKTVSVGKGDFDRIRTEGGFEPEEDQVKFYYGQDASGKTAGVVVFPQVNNQHGPLEVGLSLNPDGSIREAVVTKATVETKPWVLTAVKAGLMKRFRGMRPGDDPTRALDGLSKQELGEMPYYMAGVAAQAVKRGLVLYGVLYPR